MEINSAATLSTPNVQRPNDAERPQAQQSTLEQSEPSRPAINNEQNRPNEIQSARPAANQESLAAAREQESDRRRSEQPADQLRNRIENIVGGEQNFDSQIDEIV